MCTSKIIYTTLRNYNLFFLPLENDELVALINRFSIKELEALIYNVARTPKKLSIPRLRGIVNSFEIDYKKEINPQKTKEELKVFLKKSKNYIKMLNLLFALGDKKIVDSFEGLYSTIQNKLHTTMEQDDDTVTIIFPELHIFCFKIFSLLNPEIRTSVSKFYKEGTDHFEINHEKSHRYSKPLNLLLSNEVL